MMHLKQRYTLVLACIWVAINVVLIVVLQPFTAHATGSSLSFSKKSLDTGLVENTSVKTIAFERVNDYADLRFLEIEPVLYALRFERTNQLRDSDHSSQYALKLDEKTASQLQTLTRWFLKNNIAEKSERFYFLADKVLPPEKSGSFIALMHKFVAYQEHLEQQLATNAHGDRLQIATWRLQIQDDIFGDAIADQLFATQRKMAKFILDKS